MQQLTTADLSKSGQAGPTGNTACYRSTQCH